MISVSGKKWAEKKINKNTIEKIKQDFKFSEIISRLIISRNFDRSEIYNIENSSDISFGVGSERGCRRYHIDNVPQRLLVTYSGEGTEWIPDEAADKNAYLNGESNESILVNNSAKQFISEWNVAIFKGGSNGILHRTPDSALNKPSILMRLDHTKYWQAIYNKM